MKVILGLSNCETRGFMTALFMDVLCSYCSELGLEAALCSPADGGAAHQPSLVALKASAYKGCSLCSGIITSVQDQHPDLSCLDQSAPIFYNVWKWTEDDNAQGSAVIIFYSRPERSQRSWSTNLGIYVDEGSILSQPWRADNIGKCF